MKLPHAEHAIVESNKIERYLLSATHAHGRHKRRVFVAAGYTAQRLADALLQLARESDDVQELPSPFGRKFVVRGRIPSRSGSLTVTTIWMLRDSRPPPHFVTAYPTKP
jgi:hypothetical protein